MNVRLASLQVLQQIVQQGQNLDNALESVIPQLEQPRDQGLLQHLCYGVMRWYPQLEFLLAQLLHKPLKKKDTDLRLLLLLGLYQLRFTRIPAHAAVDETVALTKRLNKDWARGMVNAVLRNYTRRHNELEQRLEQDPSAHSAHPAWLLGALQQAWPDHWPAIVAANNTQAPMSLRVNGRRGSRDAYIKRLLDAGLTARPAAHTESGMILHEPCPVEQLPGFATGEVSVQDGAAQLAASLLDAQPGERVLDACAAPGGKTAHLLERQPDLQDLIALDRDADRLQRVQDNLTRLELAATLIAGDAARPDSWWDGQPFDRILLDAPCSATGVIRRHPDIKLHRRQSDIAALAATQHAMLLALWPLLKPGGTLLYATCSVLPEENRQQVECFLAAENTARHVPLAASWGHPLSAGQQILPGEDEMDGFYYARLVKTN
ncbi:MAG: 16S rRNA (cytosine(967)-C(5))-methyltransferase RsmB [Thiohalophilus sp.]|uniref:16S rRNA (cytosine(967)-C(5))-methyltransferase RsmB n=1 Tax=Thiohalophilus sp. TaxID=3028392 RepID=UPI002870ADFA|nr:16S rRNA (cytosine(967)-C(5))-methyltransferase RsmB [Thiohalophilus sp.]MDR9437075.1 16S rRNA (cytosine(967)-C(5))-methyltransferase RsmB [Thiohalophilus sp.]